MHKSKRNKFYVENQLLPSMVSKIDMLDHKIKKIESDVNDLDVSLKEHYSEISYLKREVSIRVDMYNHLNDTTTRLNYFYTFVFFLSIINLLYGIFH